MERLIARLGYWLGLLCIVVAVLWRGFMVISDRIPAQMGSVWYSSMWKVGVMLLVISIASVNYAWLHEKKAEKPSEKPVARAA